MPEAVIVATSRTPIGRAVKGSLTEARPDDMSAFIIGDVLSKVQGLDPADVEDVIWGIGQPGGEGGYNIARVASILAGVNAPGVTVNRYCSSSLQTIRMAAHAIKAGEGDCFVAGGVETVSRYEYGAADSGPHNDDFAAAEGRTAERIAEGADPWQPPQGLQDCLRFAGGGQDCGERRNPLLDAGQFRRKFGSLPGVRTRRSGTRRVRRRVQPRDLLLHLPGLQNHPGPHSQSKDGVSDGGRRQERPGAHPPEPGASQRDRSPVRDTASTRSNGSGSLDA